MAGQEELSRPSIGEGRATSDVPSMSPLAQYSERMGATAVHLTLSLAFTASILAFLSSILVGIAWFAFNLATGLLLTATAKKAAAIEGREAPSLIWLYVLLTAVAIGTSIPPYVFFWNGGDYGPMVALTYMCCALMYIAVNYAVSLRFLVLVSTPHIIALVLLAVVSFTEPEQVIMGGEIFTISCTGLLLGFLITAQSSLKFNQMLTNALEIAQTERRAADDASIRLSQMLDQTGIGLFDWDVTTRRVYTSDFIKELVAGDENTALQMLQDPTAPVHPDDVPKVQYAAERFIAKETDVFDLTYRSRNPVEEKNGDDYRWVRSRGVGRFDDKGKMIRYIGCITDVTADIHMRERLEEARKAAEAASESKSAFLATMSHEIRTPMNGVLGMAQALSSSDLDPDQREQVDVILECGKSLLGILNDVLDLSKIESGKLVISPIEADLGEVVKGVVVLWKPSAEEKGLTIDLDMPQNQDLTCHFDPVRVRECLSNLLSNAIKFTDSGGVRIAVNVTAAKDGHWDVEIQVADTGIGIAHEIEAKLFEPFTQADDSTARRFGGTGLGLSISRHLARLMGGDLTLDRTDAAGALFTLKFQAVPVEPKSNLLEDGAVHGSSDADPCALKFAPKVLIVDDNDTNRQIARLFLEPSGAIMVDAADGKEALEALGRESFDLVLLDMHMPVMDGPETLQCIRDAQQPWRDVPVIAVTADAMRGDREKYLGLGANGYVSKPIDLKELRTEVARLVPRRRARERKVAEVH